MSLCVDLQTKGHEEAGEHQGQRDGDGHQIAAEFSVGACQCVGRCLAPVYNPLLDHAHEA